MFLGTQTDTRATVNETRYYGSAVTTYVVAAETNIIKVSIQNAAMGEGGAHQIIHEGDLVRISDKENPLTITEYEEVAVVQDITHIDSLFMQITTVDPVRFTYAVGSVVSSYIPLGDITSRIDDFTITSSSGLYAEEGVELSNTGTIEDVYTFTIKTDGISFTVSSERLGALPDGTFASNYEVPNSNFVDTNYITMLSTYWSGTWLENDTLVFKTHPSATAVWLKMVIPIGAEAYYNSSTVISFNGTTVTEYI
jgi:hypothetical protein